MTTVPNEGYISASDTSRMTRRQASGARLRLGLLLLLGVSCDAAQLRRQRIGSFAHKLQVSVGADATVHATSTLHNLKEYCGGGGGSFLELLGSGAASSGGGGPQFEVGQRIEGDWKNYGHWYPGKIAKINADGTYDIKYDDGFTERGVKLDNVHDPDAPEQTEGIDPKDDAACEVAEEAQALSVEISETGRVVSRYIAEQASEEVDAALDASEADDEARKAARKAAKEKARADANDFSSSWRLRAGGWDWRSWKNRDDYWEKYKAEAEAKKAEVRGETLGPAPAAAPLPEGLASHEGGDLVDVKTEIIDVETEIHELEVQVADNDERLREFRLGTKGSEASSSAADAISDSPTLDDLIKAYRTRLEERKSRREELKKVVEEQSKELESYAKGSENEKVTVDKLRKAVEEVEKKVDKVWAKREKLVKDGRMDDELDHAIKQVKKDAEKVAAKVSDIEKAEREATRAKAFAKKVEEQGAAKLREEREEAREEMARLQERLANAEKGQEREAREQIEALEAKSAAGEARVAKDLAEQKKATEAAQKNLLEVSQAAEEEVHRASEKADNLNTGLTPSADKWWRYRYEWSYVEAGLMIWIAFLMLWWEFVYQRVLGYVQSFIAGGSETIYTLHMATLGTTQEMWLRSFAEMLVNCTMTFLTVWVMAKLKLWDNAEHILTPHAGGMHMPTDAQEYRRMAVDLCAILFFAVVFYFSLVYSVVRSTTVFLEHMSEEAAEEGLPLRAKSMITRVVSHFSSNSFVVLSYKDLKDHWFENISDDPSLDAATKASLMKPDFNFLIYLRMSVNKTTSYTFEFGVFVWILIISVFWVHLALHLHAHIAYVRIMTTYLIVTIFVLVAMQLMIFKYQKEVQAEVMGEREEEEVTARSRSTARQQRHESFVSGQYVFFSVLNFLLFMMCYGFSRMICNAWMWEMYFWNVVTVFCITLCLAAFFVALIAPLVTALGALSCLPPHLSKDHKELALIVSSPGKMSAAVTK
mmetsp:Transcript_34516/g.102539  ORF Transcript_34516/g.102539 Transcript_34516/m.102539 type:complete len:991 (-) Transcript_34516:30-3002(-)